MADAPYPVKPLAKEPACYHVRTAIQAPVTIKIVEGFHNCDLFTFFLYLFGAFRAFSD